MKITLKTFVLVALVIFNLVIIISNFTTYEGLENNSNEAPKKEKTAEELQDATEPTKEDIKYGLVGEGDMQKS
jgi:large-conductance mechanosensitive channel